MRKLGIIFTLCLFLTFLIVGATVAGSVRAVDLPDNLTHQLRELTGGKARISTHAKTGKVRFIGTELSHPIPQPAIFKAIASPEGAARGFLSTYGSLFGLTDQARELTVMRSKTVDDGRSFVRFQQVHDDVPVVGGELIVQVDSAGNTISANGEVLPDISLDTTPTVAASSAQEAALDVVVKEYGIDPDALRVSKPELWIYNPIILGMNWDMTSLVWRMEVESVELLPIRELVLVDANLGVVALHFNQVTTGKYREVYDNENDDTYGLPGNGPVRIEGQGAHSIDDVNYAYDYTGYTYDFYWNEHGRDSIDDAGMNLTSTVRYCDPSQACPYANAFWTPTYHQMVFGEGYSSADDIVGHEMTHGVTSYESNLFYYMQSGAINEAFSDIWGEFVDLTNGAGNDTPGVRWLIGEDFPGGAMRDMSNPPAYNSGLGWMPDKMTSTYYYCGSLDNGGVHHNMGVGCKAAYLMVDGGSFNGYTVAGFGGDTAAIAQAADLWYEVQTNLFTSASDYADLYDCLQQAAINLGFSPADRQTVKDAVDATEMNLQPPSCPATEAPICDSGSPRNLWFDDLENIASGYWASGALQGSNEWYYPQNSHSYTGWDFTYATSGQYNIWGYDQPAIGDCYIAMTQDVALPPGSQPYLHFSHAYSFEVYLGGIPCDGGVVEYSTDSGSSWKDASSLFTHNGYTGTISSLFDNPLGGWSAFVGYSHGYISSRLDLSSLAGHNIRFRFRIGTDSGGDDYGWFIDDIRIYTCGIPVVEPTVTTSAATLVEETTATLNGDITDTGGENCDYRGFVWGDESHSNPGNTAPASSGYDSSWSKSGSYGTGTFNRCISGLSEGTKYYYRACARNSAGWSYGSEQTFLTKPGAPTSFGATAAGSTQIDLSWAKGDGAQKTKIQRKQHSYPTDRNDGTTVYFDTGTGTSDTGLNASTTYYYRAWSYVTGSEQWSEGYAEDYTTTAPLQPDITVSPTSFEVTLPPDTTHDYTLTISNDGEADLSYNISEGGCPWLSENPISGTVGPGGSHNITVSINTTGLAMGDYSAEIVIASNDPDEDPHGAIT